MNLTGFSLRSNSNAVNAPETHLQGYFWCVKLQIQRQKTFSVHIIYEIKKISPVYIHFLRRLGGFIIGNFSRNPNGDDERNDPAADVHRGVGLVQLRVVRVTCRRRWRGLGFDPVRCVVVGAALLLQPLPPVRAAEAQEAAAAAEAVVGVVAGELFVVLAAHVVVAQAGVVLHRGRLDLRDPPRDDRGQRDRSGAAVDLLHLWGPPRRVFALFIGGGGAQDIQRV